MNITERYNRARLDHEYLWGTYFDADDMTGGYVDSNDLHRLLKSPTKKTAAECYEDQIRYWMMVGPDRNFVTDTEWKRDPKVREIAVRHRCEDEMDIMLGYHPD